MFKLIAFACLLAVVAAKPKPHGIAGYTEPIAYTHPVATAPLTYTHSVATAPLTYTHPVATAPLAYSAPLAGHSAFSYGSIAAPISYAAPSYAYGDYAHSGAIAYGTNYGIGHNLAW